MEGTIKVSPEKIALAANCISSFAGKSLESVEMLAGIVNNFSDEVWTADEADAFKKEINDLKAKVEEAVKKMQAHAQEINKMAYAELSEEEKVAVDAGINDAFSDKMYHGDFTEVID